MEFLTTDYEFAHGRKPKGRGGWYFSTERTPNFDDPNTFFSANGTYGEAKKAARVHFRGKADAVWVLS